MESIHSEAQKNSASRQGSRPPKETFERRMMLYALAAGAATACACAPASQAKVVFTPSRTEYHTSRRVLEIHDNVEISDEKFDPPAEGVARIK